MHIYTMKQYEAMKSRRDRDTDALAGKLGIFLAGFGTGSIIVLLAWAHDFINANV